MEQQQTQVRLSEIILENERIRKLQNENECEIIEPGPIDAFIAWIVENYNGVCGIPVNFNHKDKDAFYSGMLGVVEIWANVYSWQNFQKVIKDGMLGKYGPVYNLSARQVNLWLMEYRRRENSKI